MSETADEKDTNGSGSAGFWPDETVDAVSAVVVLLALVAMAVYFVGGDLLLDALL